VSAELLLLLLRELAAGLALAVVGVPHEHGSHLKTEGTDSSSRHMVSVAIMVLIDPAQKQWQHCAVGCTAACQAGT
jgi:hypothetical protein